MSRRWWWNSGIGPTRRSQLIGSLHPADGMAFMDQTGCVLPVFCHAGDLLALFARDPSWAEAELDDIAAVGYDGVRTWTWLEGPYWERLERVYIPTSRFHGTYWETIRDFALALRQRGLRWIVSQGDMLRFAPDRYAFMRRLASLLQECGGLEVAAAIDAGNEAWQNGEDDPQRLRAAVESFRAILPVPIWSLTSPRGEEKAELDRYSGSVYDVHSARAGNESDWIRHVFGIAYEQRPVKRLGINSEGPGAGDDRHGGLISVQNWAPSAEGMALLTAMQLMSRQIPVYMSSSGVSVRRPGEFAQQTGFHEATAIRDVLPRDLMRFQTLCHGGKEWRGARILCAVGEGDSLIRADHAIHNDGRFMVVVYAARPGDWVDWVVGIPVEQRCELRVIHPATQEILTTTSCQPGEVVGMRFNTGRIVLGRVL